VPAHGSISARERTILKTGSPNRLAIISTFMPLRQRRLEVPDDLLALGGGIAQHARSLSWKFTPYSPARRASARCGPGRRPATASPVDPRRVAGWSESERKAVYGARRVRVLQ
jgi:hypothetical protein